MSKSAQTSLAQYLLLVAVMIVGLGWSLTAAAQIDLNRYQPAATTSDGFALSRPTQAGHLRFGAQVQLDYAKDPLIWTMGDIRRSIVRDQLVAHLAVSLGLFDRVLLSVQLPVNLMLKGDGLPDGSDPADGSSIGDLSLGARVRVAGDDEDPVAFGAYAAVTFPMAHWTRDDVHYAGGSTAVGRFGILLEIRPFDRLRVGGALGLRLRGGQELVDVDVNSDLTYVLGGGFDLIPGDTRLELLLELHGSTLFSKPFGRDESPFEALLGLKLHLIQGLTFGVAGDLAVSEGIGSPLYRVIGMLGWQMPNARATDEDKDGIVDALDRCPREPEDVDGFEDSDGCPEPDKDKDGILNAQDKCPREPEDMDGFEDSDGCPEPDKDQDGILNAQDKCPLQAEDTDGFEDADGCPDPDNDGDGVLDGADKCPSEAEDKDGFEDADGCPDPDNDADGVPDAQDKCPLEAETRNGRDDEDGCPDLVRVDRATNKLLIMQPVMFANNSDKVLDASFDMLAEMAAVIKTHPEISSVAIEGHTDARGNPKKNLTLSDGRAKSVREFLIGAGVAPDRLTAQGFGQTVPVADNKTEDGRAQNRRVEFRLNFAEPPPRSEH